MIGHALTIPNLAAQVKSETSFVIPVGPLSSRSAMSNSWG